MSRAVQGGIHGASGKGRPCLLVSALSPRRATERGSAEMVRPQAWPGAKRWVRRTGARLRAARRTMRARLHHHSRSRIPGEKHGQHFAGVDDYFFGVNLARFIEDAGVMPAIPEVQSDGQVFTSRFFCFHKTGVYTPAFSFLLVRLLFRHRRAHATRPSSVQLKCISSAKVSGMMIPAVIPGEMTSISRPYACIV
jgi:hypothetical protein